MAPLSSSPRKSGGVRITEPRSGLSARFRLLFDLAPANSCALWSLAGGSGPHDALHAMWTGPEISCPIAAERLPVDIDLPNLPLENATCRPQAGDLVLVRLEPGASGPTRPFAKGGLDLGIFYGCNGRLFFPGGWIEGSVCARVEDPDKAALAIAAAAIRRNGACQLELEQLP